MSKVSGAAEKAREEVEGIVLAWATALLVLLDAIVAVLVVNLACVLFDKDLVGFSYLDELSTCLIVATAIC
jgi:hypothetical protein